MVELIALLSIYYPCSALADAGQLSQPARFECNQTYQAAKRQFLEESLRDPWVPLTQEQNTEAYLLFKAWEADNPDLVQRLKTQ